MWLLQIFCFIVRFIYFSSKFLQFNVWKFNLMSLPQIIYTDFTYIDYDTDIFVDILTENLLSQVENTRL